MGLFDAGPDRYVLGQKIATMLSPAVRQTPFRVYYERLAGGGTQLMTGHGNVAGKIASALPGVLKTLVPTTSCAD